MHCYHNKITNFTKIEERTYTLITNKFVGSCDKRNYHEGVLTGEVCHILELF